jgi:tRNA(Ile)-lysidine synthase
MASSKKQPENNVSKQRNDTLKTQLRLFLDTLLQSQNLSNPTLLVAYSGGLDSTVLLHLLYQMKKEVTFFLKAMHVSHGLSPNADSWAIFCQNMCHQFAVPIDVVSVDVDKDSGLGIEATARHVRYAALNNATADFICLGHHQDDQAETFLLQLARGAGVKGIASMAQFDSKRRLLRPLLNTKRSVLVDYAIQHQLQWIEDESNADTHFDRNFIRHTLIPTFNQRYKDIQSTLARSAMHMGDASQLLDDLGAIDANLVLDDNHLFGALRLDALFNLSHARQGNLIRWWFANNQISMPSTALLSQILYQLQSKKTDAAIKIKVSKNLKLMRYQGYAYLVQETQKTFSINHLWQGEESLLLPDQSRLSFTKKLGEGFAYQRSGPAIQLRIRSREGGEYFKPAIGRPRRRLKTILQSCSIPPWKRDQLPLIFMDETLVIIPNIGVNAEMKAREHEMGLMATWEPRDSQN